MQLRLATLTLVALLTITLRPALAEHRLLVQGNGKLAILEADGSVEWEMPWGPIHDVHVLANGHIMVQQGAAKVAEIDPDTKQVVWSYDSATANGNAGRKVEVHAFQPLENDRVMIAESGRGRIIEVDRSGKLLKEIRLKIDNPHPHTDTRLARKLASGNYLVCHEGDAAVREYNGSGQVVWDYKVPMFGRKPKPGHGPEAFGNKCFAAVRLSDGNTLISTGNGHSVIEVTPDKQIIWEVHQHDLHRDLKLAWVTTLEILPSGNYLIGNCHAGPGQPLVFELEPKSKQVVWKFDGFDTFGNNVSNTQVLDAEGRVLR